MVRRAFMKHASLYIFGGILLIGLALAALNYRTLFSHSATPATPAQTPKREAAIQVRPLTAESLLYYTNAARKQAGLNELTLDEHLNTSAAAKADDMNTNGYYDHTNPATGQPGYDFIYANMPQVCKFVGENLYRFDGDPTDPKTDYAKKAVNTWVAEERDQKEALFDPGYTLVGFGIKGKYVVQHLCELKQ